MKNLIKGSKGNSQYLEGLKAGGRQFEKEMEGRIMTLKESQSKNKKFREKGKGFEM